MKKLAWILGGLVVVFLVAVISIPLFVDVDQYRPRIVSEANKRINGQLELGKLKLSLWGTIKIHADSIKLTVNGFPKPMVDTQQFHIEIPVMSVLTGAPQVIAVLEAPKISIVKEANGTMNAMELMKVPGAEAATAPAPVTPVAPVGKNAPPSQVAAAKATPAVNAAAKAAQAVNNAANQAAANQAATSGTQNTAQGQAAPQVPAILAGARLGIRINDGNLDYQDKGTHSDYQVVGLEVNAKNLGLGSNMEISVKAPVKGESPTMTFEGPISAELELKPTLAGTSVKSVSGKMDFDATKLKVEMKGGIFHKTDSMPLTAHAQFDGSQSETLLRALDLQFTDFKLHGNGRLTMDPMTVKLEVTTDPGTVKLDKVQTFVPMVAAYDLKGVANLNVKVDWKPEALRANGDLSVDGGSFFMKDVLKAPMGYNAKMGFSESSLTVTRVGLTAPDSDLELTGSVKNFLAPQFSFAISGKSFDVDKAIVLPPPGAAKKTAEGFSLMPAAYATETPPAADVNPMLAMARNPMVMGAAGTITAQIGKITTYNAVMENVSARVVLERGLMLKIPEAALKAFGGAMHTSGEFDLKNPSLTYHSQGNVSSVSAKEALKSQFPQYQNTLEGTVDANWNMAGTAYPAATRMHNIKGNAKLSARDGAVKSVDFQSSINGALAKIPFLKGQQVKIDNGFKTFTADVNLNGGVIKIDPINIEPKGQGVVIKGKSTISENLTQDTYVDVYDPQHILPAQLSAGANKPVIPLHITGALSGPQTDYGYTLQRVATNAGKNMLQDQALKALNLPTGGQNGQQPDLKKAASDLLKKGFHL